MLYDRQMESLKLSYTDLYIDTSFGKTHLIACGSQTGKPLLVFHGGNATPAYNLKYCDCLFPAKKVLWKARKVWKQSVCYLLKDRGHIHGLTDREKKMIVDFLIVE